MAQKYIGNPTISGTPQQLEAARTLLLRAQEDIPIGSLNGLTIKFVPEGESIYEQQVKLTEPQKIFWRIEETLANNTGEYNPDNKTLYLKSTARQRTFYHEIAHYLADLEGKLFEYGYHKKAREFGRKWGNLQRITSV